MDLLFDYSCVNGEVYCLCRDCKENKNNGGTCTRCFVCIKGEASMDTCKYHKE